MTVKNPFDQTRKFQFTNKLEKVIPLGNTILVSNMSFGERFTSGGIVLLLDDGKAGGIRPRWCQVYAIGPDQRDVKVGEWICVTHGRWSRGTTIETADGTFTIRKVDPKDVLMSSNELPHDDTLSMAISGNPA